MATGCMFLASPLSHNDDFDSMLKTRLPISVWRCAVEERFVQDNGNDKEVKEIEGNENWLTKRHNTDVFYRVKPKEVQYVLLMMAYHVAYGLQNGHTNGVYLLASPEVCVRLRIISQLLDITPSSTLHDLSGDDVVEIAKFWKEMY